MPTLRLMAVLASAVGLIPLVAGAPMLGNGEAGSDRTFDLTEYAAFFGCFSGAGVDAGVDCAGVDVDNDSDVDLADFSRFQSVFGMSPPEGMVPIPGGSFEMGDTSHDGYLNEFPVHSVYLSPYYIDKYEVTKGLWDTVRTWATSNGYGLIAGSGKAADHPVHSLNWYDCVKWSNARSQQEGRTPCYYTDAGLTTVYKTGEVAPYVKWDANGYRLPTEAEWEKAARGGVSGRRFPWSDTDTIQHTRANYFSSSDYSYDTSPTRGTHPTFDTGDSPYTSPVGYFAPNDYGIHDMAGNVAEWCNDWYLDTYYSSSPGSNPAGAASGTNRVARGGLWGSVANPCRSANRRWYWPGYHSIGFRCASGAP